MAGVGLRQGVDAKTYYAWLSMKKRCNSSNGKDYVYYKALDLSYQESWEFYDNFLADMGEAPPELTLERLDNNKGYFKGNCKWATKVEQARNKSSTKLDLVRAEEIRAKYAKGGVTYAELGKCYGVSKVMIGLIIKGRYWKLGECDDRE